MEKNTKFTREITFIKSILSSWADLELCDIHFTRLLGGYSNFVYKVSHTNPTIQPQIIILRRFNQEEDMDRRKERKIFEYLSKNNLAPKYYIYDEEFRLEHFIEGRNLKPSDFKESKTRRRLALVLALFNNGKVEGLDNKKLVSIQFLQDEEIFTKFNQRIDNIENEADNFTVDELAFLREIQYLASIKERNFLMDIIPKDDIVFSHNDIHVNNMLYCEKSGKLMLMDLENAGYNFRGYDIGDFFGELQFETTLSKTPPFYFFKRDNYPCEEHINDFLEYYYIGVKLNDKLNHDYIETLVNNEDEFNHVKINMLENEISSASAMQPQMELMAICQTYKSWYQTLRRNIMIGDLLTSYFLTIWAVNMCKKNKNIYYDHLADAKDRYHCYLERKSDLLQQNLNERSQEINYDIVY